MAEVLQRLSYRLREQARSHTGSQAAPDSALWRDRLALTQWTAPTLPVRGADLIARGLAQGPAVGRILHAFEDWWIAEDFPRDEYLLARTLSNLVKASR